MYTSHGCNECHFPTLVYFEETFPIKGVGFVYSGEI